MARFVVVTGTDTGVGKTFVAEALARALAKERPTLAIKPFESGAADGESDAARLAAATGQEAPREALVRLREPLAPAMAADREGVTLDFDRLVEALRAYGERADVVLVEGAGGVLSPLTWEHDARDLAAALAARVVLVASDRLGTLSATHAAFDALARAGRAPAAIVLSAPALADASTGANAAALRRRLPPTAPAAIVVPRTTAFEASFGLTFLARELAGI
ncbi:MAG: dethiobiotin synthase [Sandaracinus sp.]